VSSHRATPSNGMRQVESMTRSLPVAVLTPLAALSDDPVAIAPVIQCSLHFFVFFLGLQCMQVFKSEVLAVSGQVDLAVDA